MAVELLRCDLCNKPFDKEATLRRHSYYCRSRHRGYVKRPRSCLGCAQRKARCDTYRPSCSRCLRHGSQCQYPEPVPSRRGSAKERSSSNKKAISGVDEDYEVLVDTRAPTTPFQALHFAEEDYHLFQDSEWAQTELISATAVSNQPYKSPPFQVPEVFDIPDTDRYQVDRQPHVVNLQYTPTQNIELFLQRPRSGRQAQPITSLLFRTLKSYPEKMLQTNVMPPFVHTGILTHSSDNDDWEALRTCQLLVYMLHDPSPAAKRLFWKNVRWECERVCKGAANANMRQLLAALQALLVYVLIRIGQPGPHEDNLDVLLVRTVIMAATHFNYHMSFISFQSSSPPNWENWILAESALRICVTYQVLNMLVYFEPAAMCDLKAAPLALPAKRQCWEAPNEFVWKNVRSSDANAGESFAMTGDGQILRLGYDQACHGKNPLDVKAEPMGLVQEPTWDEWSANTDSLGELAMLAASLIS